MSLSQYKHVRAVVGEANLLLRDSMHAALFGQGIRNVAICGRGDALRQAINREIVDVLVCDTRLPGMDFRGMVQDIRQTRLGRNPFMSIIAVVSETNEDQIRQVIDTGVDDLVRKPMPMGMLLGRIHNLASHRKPFVLSATYVGPSRRTGGVPRHEGDILVEVPNTLHSKVVDRIGLEKVETALSAAVSDFQEQRERSPALAVHHMIERIRSHYRGTRKPAELVRDFAQLILLAAELARVNRGTSSAYLVEVAASLQRIAKRLSVAPLPAPDADLELLVSLGEVVRGSAERCDRPAKAMAQMPAAAGKFFHKGESPSTAGRL